MTAYVPPGNCNSFRLLILAIQQLASGRSNATGIVTLAASATSTTVSDKNCAQGSAIALTPQTANAAAALTTSYVASSNGSFVITHANNAQTDRKYTYAIIG